MNNYKNKKKAILLALVASLTTTSLAGCGYSEIRGTNIKIKWEDGKVKDGTISYDDKENIKVVILEQNGTIQPLLVVKGVQRLLSSMDSGATVVSYLDFKNGKTIMEYELEGSSANIDTDEPSKFLEGKYINILEEKSFYDWLTNYGEIIDELDALKVLELYNNDVEPKVLKYIEEEYNYTKKLENN